MVSPQSLYNNRYISVKEIFFMLQCPRGRLAPPASTNPVRSLDSLLRQCSTPRQAKQIHAHLLISSPSTSVSFLFAQLISLYCRFNLLCHANSLFNSTSSSSRSSLLCNSILRANLSHACPRHAISLYSSMNSTTPDAFTFPLVIKACSQLEDSNLCPLIHTHVLVHGLKAHVHVCNELISAYAKLGRIRIARTVFDEMPFKNVVSWNVLISGYASHFDFEQALDVFRKMEEVGPAPNTVTWTSLLSAHGRRRRHSDVVMLFDEMRGKGGECTAEIVAVVLSGCAYLERGGLEVGKKMHSYVVRIGFERYLIVRNSMVCMYGKLGCSVDAESIFSETEDKSLVSWNALISSYAASGLCDESYKAFLQLEKCHLVQPNVVSWSAMIKGFSSAGMAESSLDMFRQMQQAGVFANSITIASVLSSCAEISALDLGREVHSHIIRWHMDHNILVCNGLLNMYTKCGSLRYCMLVFDRMKEKDLISWNTMITGFGMHGLCDDAVGTFNDLVRNGIMPDEVTFVAVLSACSHAGRVSEGRQLFHRMMHEFKLTPAMEHYSSIVDLLGRAGLLREATDIIEGMPFKPNVCVVGALLNSYRIHGNTTIAEDFTAGVLELEGQTSGNYMLLSNIYAASGNWGESARVRAMTRAKGLKKQAGQSWVEVGKKFFVFSAGSSMADGGEKVYGVIEGLSEQMERDNYVSENWILLNCLETE